jgi:plastocyanin
MKLRSLPLAALLSVAAPASAANVTVELLTITFVPATVTIKAGDSVIWTNTTGIHNVVADDGSFTSGPAKGGTWTYSHTFNTPGEFTYYCVVHASAATTVGMRGKVIVEENGGTGGNDAPGTLRFSQVNYQVGEGAGNATITVQRINGDDGAVGVTYSVTAGTAAAGADFTATTGTLSWADNDDDSKTFQVAINDDGSNEANETIKLALQSPTGGAALDSRKSATLTVNDDDGATDTAPAAPTALLAQTLTASEIILAWTDNANNETGYRIERKPLGGSFAEIGTAPADATGFTDPGLAEATFFTYRVRAEGSGGTFSAFSNEAGEATHATPAPCVPGDSTLCVNNNRFQVEVDFRTGDGPGTGSAQPISSAPDSGLFYSFSPSNLEMLVKVLNACAFDRYWVFYAATTNVEFTLTVTDTQTGRVKVYFNPLGRPAPPVQDTEAFATCP